MTNGEKFEAVFGFGADGSRVIAVNSDWWDCDFRIGKPQTNADRIRSMTDEELEDFLDRWGLGDINYSKTFCDMCEGQFDCHECRLDWLKQEATDGQS